MFAQSTIISHHTEACVKTEVGCTVAREDKNLGAQVLWHTVNLPGELRVHLIFKSFDRKYLPPVAGVATDV